MNKSISESFGESIVKNTMDVSLDTSEVILDSFMKEGILKKLPIIKYAVSAYNIVDDIKGRFFLNKLKSFIASFNSGNVTEKDVEKQKKKFFDKNRDNELAYITIIIDNYLDIEKPELLAKMYLAYLDYLINWDEFCAYSEIINNLLRMDIKFMLDNKTVTTKNNEITSELLRLTGNGLMSGYQNDSPFESDGQGGISIYSDSFDRVISKERVFSRTRFGERFIRIINDY